MDQRFLPTNNLALEHIAKGAPLERTLTCIVNDLEAQNPEILGAILLLSEDGSGIYLGAGPSLHQDYRRAIDGVADGVDVWVRQLAMDKAHQSTAENTDASRFWRDFCDLALLHGLYAGTAVPILSTTNQVVGLFISYSREPSRVHDPQRQVILNAATMAAIAIERNTDKTRIEKAENSLRENETRMALAIEGSGTGIWDRNVLANEIHYSTQWKAILGYADTEIGNRIEDSYTRVHPDDLAFVQATIQAHFDQKTESYAVEHRIRCKDASYKWVASRGKVVSRDAEGKPLRMIGTTTDITAIRAMSERLQQSVDLIINLTNQIPGLVFQYRRLPNGDACFNYLSEGINDIYEFTADQIADNVSLVHERIHPDDLKNYRASLDACATDLMPWHLEYRVILPRQGVRWLRGDARLRRLPDGSTLWHGFVTDITERKQARDLLEQTQNQLVQSEKLAAIGQLAAGVAHEINNPIGFVSSNFCQLVDYINELFSLISKYECGQDQLSQELQSSISATRDQIDISYLKEDVPQLLSQSMDGIDRVQKIIRSLRDFSRVDAIHKQCIFNIHAGIESTLNIVRNELKHVTVHKEFDHMLPEIECIGSQINQVILNLLVNAAHSISDSGDIWIRTGSKNQQIFIEISDNGVGIAPDIQARIFEPFFTTKPIGKGTGLGLSVSYGIIQKHGGKIELTSELQRGSIFTIWLPIRYPSQQ